MSYKVHKYPVDRVIDDRALENFLNTLDGEIIAVFPNLVPKFHMMGATAGVDSLIIVEKRRP